MSEMVLSGIRDSNAKNPYNLSLFQLPAYGKAQRLDVLVIDLGDVGTVIDILKVQTPGTKATGIRSKCSLHLLITPMVFKSKQDGTARMRFLLVRIAPPRFGENNGSSRMYSKS